MPFFQRSPHFTGYIRRRSAVKEFVQSTHKPYLAQQSADIRGSSKDKAVRLVKAYEQASTLPYELHEVQELGDCVGQHFTLGVDTLCAVDVAHGHRTEWKGRHSTEYTYATSRVEVGGGKIRGDGSTGAWAAQAVMQYGALYRANWRSYDLNEYRPDLAKRWGDMGVPDELEPYARVHPVKTATLCGSAEEAADAIANGYPVAVCSNQGFDNHTDSDGFLAPRGTWYHCMLCWGMDRRTGKRPGFEFAQKWPPSWVSGPRHELGTAVSGFWTDWDVADRMIRQGDSFVLSGFVGYPARKLEYILL